MWELDHKGSWAPKNWCFWTVVLKKTLESPLDWKEIKPVFPKGNSSGIFIGSTDSEGETLIFGHLMWRSDSLEKTLMLGNSESESRRDDSHQLNHQLNGHELDQAPGFGDAQGCLVCCSPWGRKKLDITESLICRKKNELCVKWFLRSSLF